MGAGNGYLVRYEQASAGATTFISRGNLQAGGTVLKVGTYSSPAVTDLDGNGLLDLLVGNSLGNVARYEQVSAGATSFAAASFPLASTQIENLVRPMVTDLDGDGRLDLLVGNSTGNVARYVQAGNPLTITAVAPTPNAPAAAPTSAVQVTFNKALTASSASALQVFSAQRGGRRTGAQPATVSGNQLTFTPSAYAFQPGETVQATVTTAAQSSDGGQLAAPRVFQFTAATGGPGRGNFSNAPGVPVGNNPFGIAVGDVNGDGKLDFLTANTSGITSSGGSGTPTPVSNGGSVSVRLSNGTGGFSNAPDVAVGNGPSGVVVGDMDGDGD